VEKIEDVGRRGFGGLNFCLKYKTLLIWGN